MTEDGAAFRHVAKEAKTGPVGSRAGRLRLAPPPASLGFDDPCLVFSLTEETAGDIGPEEVTQVRQG